MMHRSGPLLRTWSMSRFSPILLIVVVFTSCSRGKADVSCPESEDDNCSCYVFDERVFLECPAISLTSLRSVLASFRSISLESLSVFELDKSVTTLPADTFAKSRIHQLQISASSISHLYEESFKDLKTSLESLSVVTSKLTKVPRNALFHALSLKSVNFESNEIQELPDHCFHGLQLEKIALKNNHVREVSEFAFAGLENTLRDLDLSENKLTHFPALAVKRMEALEILKIAWNEISYMPDDGYSNLKSVILLDLSGNNFPSLTELAFRSTPSLKTLSLYDNVIEGVHKAAFANLIHLESVDLSRNKITRLDYETFANNRKLVTVDFSHNHLHRLNGVFSNLPYLTELILSENNILHVSSSDLSNSTDLTVLHLQQNSIRTISRTAFASLPALGQLHLSENFIKTIPFLNCSELSALYLDKNDISEIPAGTFGAAQNLKELRLNDNSLRAVRKDTFADIPHLLELHLQNNALIKIESGAFRTMEQLQHVNLQNNQLTAIGDIFGPSASLISIQLDSNNIAQFTNASLKGQSNVQIMWLGKNKLSRIDRAIFADLLLVQKVYLNDNAISVVESGAFEPMQILTLLDFSGNELRLVSAKMFSDLTNLEELRLNRNKIQAIEPKSFHHLKNLRLLDLSGNRLNVLRGDLFHPSLPLETLRIDDCSTNIVEDDLFAPLTSLRTLTLERNHLNDLFLSKLKMADLRSLKMSGNNVSKLEDDIFKGIHSLQQLDLRGNEIQILERNAFRNATALSTLDLGRNKLRNLPKDVFKWTPLEELHLDGNALKSFPYAAVADVYSLRRLNISENEITAMDLSKMKFNLTLLDASGNALTVLTTSPANFTGMNELRLGRNALEEISNLYAANLKTLDLSFNAVKSVKSANFPKLKSLNLTSNPSTKFVDVFESLEELYVSNCNITFRLLGRLFPNLSKLHSRSNGLSFLPPEVWEDSSNLLFLDLSENEFRAFPDLKGLQQLQTLNMSRNALKVLTPLRLKALQTLDLSQNKVEIVPEGVFEGMDNLVELRMAGNGIGEVQREAFRPLKKLTDLDLRGNRLERLPLEAFRPLEVQIARIKAEENPLQCGCRDLELWEWLQDHEKIVRPDKRDVGLKCASSKAAEFLDLIPEDFCPDPSSMKIFLKDIQSYSVVVSWEGNFTDDGGVCRISHRAVGLPQHSNTSLVGSELYDWSDGKSWVKVSDLRPGWRYLICVSGWEKNETAVRRHHQHQQKSAKASRCVEVKTLDAGDDASARNPLESSILTRRLGLIIGTCMGAVVFVILVTVLAYMKMKQQKEAAKNEQPLPQEYLSYRHFSLHGMDPVAAHAAQLTTALNF